MIKSLFRDAWQLVQRRPQFAFLPWTIGWYLTHTKTERISYLDEVLKDGDL